MTQSLPEPSRATRRIFLASGPAAAVWGTAWAIVEPSADWSISAATKSDAEFKTISS